MDKRKKFRIVLDVETANGLESPLVYDFGMAVTDRHGNIYESYSLTIRDVFFFEKDLMQSAYYAEKLPMYYAAHRDKTRTVITLYEARKLLHDLCEKYNTLDIYAYNAFFDRNSLTQTQRYITKSKYRFFLPYGAKVHCIWHMACQVICTQKTYRTWARKNGFVSAKGNIRTSAEVVYKYLSNDNEFEEEHTGLADVEIETAIMAHCIRQKKKMSTKINRWCWRIPQTKAV